MAKLDLPVGPARIFDAVWKPLGRHLGGEDRMRLGGGTALAVRWQHRHSTVVDLFVDPVPYARLFRGRERFRADLELHAGGVRGIIVDPEYARIIVDDGGEASVSTSPPLSDRPVSGDTVRGSRVPLETTVEILANKLGDRMIRNAEIVPRDLYDLAVARRRDPDALQAALSLCSANDLDDIDSELRYLRPDWIRRSRQPLVAPASQPDADNAVVFVRREIQRHIRSRARGVDRGFAPGR